MGEYQLRVEPQVSEIARLIDWVEACCGEHGVNAAIRLKMTLAIEEAVTNVITHGLGSTPRSPAHPITICLEVTASMLAAEVIDEGDAFDPTTAPVPDLSLTLEQRRPGGLGIHLMRAVLDRLEYHRRNGRNILRLEKSRE